MVEPSCVVCGGTGQVYPEDYDVILAEPVTRHEPCGACKGTGRRAVAPPQPAAQAAFEEMETP